MQIQLSSCPFRARSFHGSQPALHFSSGHEETQEKDGQILFFSDHEVVNEIYN